MNTPFLEIFKKDICNGPVCITYKEREDVVYTKFFYKVEDVDFYDETNDVFHLVSHIDNKTKTIKGCDIIKFESLKEDDTFDVKKYFLDKAKEAKHNYETLSVINPLFVNFDDSFFNEDVQLNRLKLACLLKLPSLDSFENGGEDTLIRIKEVWKAQIELHKGEILKYLDSEINPSDALYDEETINEVKHLICDFDTDLALKAIDTKDELFKYWPSILLPAPDFINEIYLLSYNVNII
jgi:hypothetical protein